MSLFLWMTSVFHNCRPKDCFLDADGGTDHTLKIPYEKCGVAEDEEGFLSQVVVVQHDDWLIFPGDLAFSLQCRRSGDKVVKDKDVNKITIYVGAFNQMNLSASSKYVNYVVH